MALFSGRFWTRLTALDARLVASQRAHQGCSARLLVGRRLVTGESLVEYWIELMYTTRAAGTAATDLSRFCAGRSKGVATAPASIREAEIAALGRAFGMVRVRLRQRREGAARDAGVVRSGWDGTAVRVGVQTRTRRLS